jgi:hypothetical protein
MVAGNRYLFVSERHYSQILVFDIDLDLSPVKILGCGHGNADDQFYKPWGMALFKGFLLVADQHNNRLQIIDVRSSDLEKWTFSGTFDVDQPVTLCVVADKLYVATQNPPIFVAFRNTYKYPCSLQCFECSLNHETLSLRWLWTKETNDLPFILRALPDQPQTGTTLMMGNMGGSRILKMSSDGKSTDVIDCYNYNGQRESPTLAGIASGQYLFIPNYSFGRIEVFDLFKGCYLSHLPHSFITGAQDVRLIDDQFLLIIKEETLIIRDLLSQFES